MVIGITGSFGSGKTTVTKMFARMGAYVIDADKVCHSLMAPSKKAYRIIVGHFGYAILKKDRRIDRKKLSKIVFEKKSEQNLLNNIVHPGAIKEIEKLIRAKKKTKAVIIDAPLLIESGFYKKVDKIIVVKNDIRKQIDRIAHGKDMERQEALKRIRMQASLKKKAALADFIIDNSGSRRKTLSQVKKIWKQLGVDYDGKRKTGH